MPLHTASFTPGAFVSAKVGLGFAAGAMFWVACFELFVEAVEDSSKTAAIFTTAVSFVTMLCVHNYLDGLSHAVEDGVP